MLKMIDFETQVHIYHSDRGAVKAQGLKQIPGTRFPLLVLPVVVATLYSHSHAFSLTSESHRVVASANDAENIARRRELSLALPGSGSDRNYLSRYLEHIPLDRRIAVRERFWQTQ